MTGKEHLFFATTSSVALAVLSSSTYIPLVSAAAPWTIAVGGAIGGLFPDIDSPGAMMSKAVPFASRIIYDKFGHRGLMHDVLFYAVLAIFLVPRHTWLFGFFFGILTHLFLDAMTIQGVPFFFLVRGNNKNKNIHIVPNILRCSASSGCAVFYTGLMSMAVGGGLMYLNYMLS